MMDAVPYLSAAGEVFQTNQQFPIGGIALAPEEYPFLKAAGWTNASTGVMAGESTIHNSCAYEDTGNCNTRHII
jgi:hypothetical protein